MIELDGSVGEGGGQVLRTALTLSMITGQPFRITNIRARRAKPGLMRQHLVAVQAAARLSEAMVADAEVGSQALTFAPKHIAAGDYEFSIGTAGSCTLVLQAILPALLYGDATSTAPPVRFLQRAYCRLLREMGARRPAHAADGIGRRGPLFDRAGVAARAYQRRDHRPISAGRDHVWGGR